MMDRTEFKANVARLRGHFERFNVDVSDLCQWMMGLRAGKAAGRAETAALWSFLLEPAFEGIPVEDADPDRWRLAVFDAIAGLRAATLPDGRNLPPALCDAVLAATQQPSSQATQRLFHRLRDLDRAHRLVLLKAAAEWIVAHYQRGFENWKRNHEEWEKEKSAWEREHPALTAAVRTQFTEIFKNLDDRENGRKGIRRKNPRLCGLDRLKVRGPMLTLAG